MLLLSIFFLLCPGEYAYTTNPDAAPFHLQDVHLLHLITCSNSDFLYITCIALEFTKQKNGMRGELIRQGPLGHPTYCPVKALVNWVKHLWLHQVSLETPLYSYYDTHWQQIYTTTLTEHLRNTATTLGSHCGIVPSDISVGSFRSSGAMALLCLKVDTDCIQLMGRWRSDEMLHYLHVQAFPLLMPLAAQMLHHGQYSPLPNQPLGQVENKRINTIDVLCQGG